MAVLAILVKKRLLNLKVEVDGEVKHDGPLLLHCGCQRMFLRGRREELAYGAASPTASWI